MLVIPADYFAIQLHAQWMDSQNYVNVTRSSHAKLLHFPFSLFYLSWQHKAIRQFLMRGAPPETTQEQRGMEVCPNPSAFLIFNNSYSL